MMGRLIGVVVPRGDLSAADRDRMHAVFAGCFQAPSREVFERDLARKQWALLLRDAADGTIRGFTTIALSAVTVDGRQARALFSGDTVVEPACWGETALPRTWMRFARDIERAGRPTPLWWFLICMGYKTYRFLPLFTRSFWPRRDRPTPPAEQRLLDALARERFPAEYDPAAGVIRPRGPRSPLLAGVADITPERLRNPDVRFFLARNPGHGAGDELACLASLAEENLTAAAIRVRDGHGG